MRTSTQDEVMILTLDRPERRNAIDAAMRDTLAQALDDAARDPLVRAIVITGAGGSFCAGGDLGAFEDLDAHAALQLGLVTEIIEDDPVRAACERARKMLQRSPLSYGAVKRLLHLAADTDVRSGMLAESLAQTALLGSDDHREGLAAARERRMPECAGR